MGGGRHAAIMPSNKQFTSIERTRGHSHYIPAENLDHIEGRTKALGNASLLPFHSFSSAVSCSHTQALSLRNHLKEMIVVPSNGTLDLCILTQPSDRKRRHP